MNKQNIGEARRNANYVLRKVYQNTNYEVDDLTHDVEELTKLSGRLSISVDLTKTTLYVFCRTDESKVYEKAESLGFYVF